MTKAHYARALVCIHIYIYMYCYCGCMMNTGKLKATTLIVGGQVRAPDKRAFRHDSKRVLWKTEQRIRYRNHERDNNRTRIYVYYKSGKLRMRRNIYATRGVVAFARLLNVRKTPLSGSLLFASCSECLFQFNVYM